MQKSKIDIHGTKTINCESCGKDRLCYCFKENEETHIMCKECIKEDFGYHTTKKERLINAKLEYCKLCKSLTMIKDEVKTEFEGDYIINHFKCTECKNEISSRIKMWKK